MINLFESYSASEIIIFFIIFCLAIKELVTFYDWGKTRIQQGYNKNLQQKEKEDDVQSKLAEMNKTFAQKEERFAEKKQEINNGFKSLEEQIKQLADNVNLLISSDKDDIKSHITEKHHYFCHEKKWIDDYSLDCLEKRFGHYKAEGGNSFILDLMNEIRALPKQPPQE